MRKAFNQPELTVVHIKKNDIITESATVFGDATSGMIMQGAGRRMDDWYEGY